MIYNIGIDTSKEEFEACLLSYDLQTQAHQVHTRKTFANRRGGHQALLSWIGRHTTDTEGAVRVTMEATGIYYESLALYVFEHAPELHLSVVLPSHSKRYMQSRGLRSKTDKIDAYGLALMGAERLLRRWEGIDPYWRTLRQLTRTRTMLINQRTQLSNQLHALIHSGLVTQEAEEALREAIKALNIQIDELGGLIEDHLSSREEMAEDIKRLQSIPGVGLLTIATVLAETNGFDRFSSIAQLISYSGYDVVIRQSGTWTGKTQISKQGSKYIRKAMFLPAGVIVRRKKGPVYELYERLLGRHGIKMKAHVAVQKKLLTYMYTLWTNKTYYDPEVITQQRRERNTKVALPEGKATVDTPDVVAS